MSPSTYEWNRVWAFHLSIRRSVLILYFLYRLQRAVPLRLSVVNTNEKLTEVERLFFPCPRERWGEVTIPCPELLSILVRTLTSERKTAGVCVCACMSVLNVLQSHLVGREQWREVAKPFLWPNRGDSSLGGFILSHFISSASRWDCVCLAKWLLMEFLLAWQPSRVWGILAQSFACRHRVGVWERKW